jgi:hypothetical protein
VAVFEYQLELARFLNETFDEEQLPRTLLRIKEPDQDALAALLLDAFLGLDADHQQNQAMAQQDVHAYFSASRHRPLLECSWGAWEDDKLTGACLVSYWEQRQCPLLNCIVVRTNPSRQKGGSRWKRKPVAWLLLRTSLSSLAARGYPEVHALISEDNPLPTKLAVRLGVTQVGHLVERQYC